MIIITDIEGNPLKLTKTKLIEMWPTKFRHRFYVKLKDLLRVKFNGHIDIYDLPDMGPRFWPLGSGYPTYVTPFIIGCRRFDKKNFALIKKAAKLTGGK